MIAPTFSFGENPTNRAFIAPIADKLQLKSSEVANFQTASRSPAACFLRFPHPTRFKFQFSELFQILCHSEPVRTLAWESPG